jgi:hypothetical protein
MQAAEYASLFVSFPSLRLDNRAIDISHIVYLGRRMGIHVDDIGRCRRSVGTTDIPGLSFWGWLKVELAGLRLSETQDQSFFKTLEVARHAFRGYPSLEGPHILRLSQVRRMLTQRRPRPGGPC